MVEAFMHLDDRIVYHELPENRGKWYALNYAIEKTGCTLITTLDADDICLADRIERQVRVFMTVPNTQHVLTGFYHCWSQEDIDRCWSKKINQDPVLNIIEADEVRQHVLTGLSTPGINHFYTGPYETAGASAMFVRGLWDVGIRFNPPGTKTRVLLSEDSDFNFRATALVGRTVILNEKLYCYRRNTSTNKEEM
jgi:glycosyltransferase involved in cell wall biosynthesis